MPATRTSTTTATAGARSYRDVVIRLEPIIMELERSEDILIVTHQAVLRCIYAYFMKKDQEKSPWMHVPLHTLIKLTPRAYGTDEVRYPAGIDAVSTWRAKGRRPSMKSPSQSHALTERRCPLHAPFVQTMAFTLFLHTVVSFPGRTTGDWLRGGGGGRRATSPGTVAHA